MQWRSASIYMDSIPIWKLIHIPRPTTLRGAKSFTDYRKSYRMPCKCTTRTRQQDKLVQEQILTRCSNKVFRVFFLPLVVCMCAATSKFLFAKLLWLFYLCAWMMMITKLWLCLLRIFKHLCTQQHSEWIESNRGRKIPLTFYHLTITTPLSRSPAVIGTRASSN